MSGRTSNRPDCFQQWAKTSYGDPIFGYKHLVYTDQHRGAKKCVHRINSLLAAMQCSVSFVAVCYVCAFLTAV